jgi:glycine betaine/proline transport system permease protein
MNNTPTNTSSALQPPSVTQPMSELAEEFVVQNGPYYTHQFERLEDAQTFAWTFNWAAALLGPLWMAGRNIWGLFWIFIMVEMVALVQIGRGLWGDLGAYDAARAERLADMAAQRLATAQEAAAAGADNADNLAKAAEYLQQNAELARLAAEAAGSLGPALLIIGIILVLIVKGIQGVLANWTLERRFRRWRSDRTIQSGISTIGMIGASVLMAAMYPITIYRFTVTDVPDWLIAFPADKHLHGKVADWIDELFEVLTRQGDTFFSSITNGIRIMLDSTEILLVGTPWPVVMLVIVVLAWRMVGVRSAIFTVMALAYLALFGFWEKSMETVALLGTAAVICTILGIPLGVWCAKNKTVYSFARPVLDFMQTMPAFVYLIPVVAFFGIGKPPGIVATLVFGMPPVVRLTALGLQGVPHSVKEAATAFGASKRYLLFKIELPLAMPSIMAGINQTILMCLSMVVIASLIGAEGLGGDVLEALQYAAEGAGILAGLAILCCAIVLDRIVQGRGASQTSSRM